MLPVSKRHTLYLEVSGNPDGIPVIVLHGGPGGSSSPFLRQLFNPQFYRIIIYDQRGCGNSTPFADLVENTTWDLVNDIETIRRFLGVEQWLVFGGSWGSTLALSYTIMHRKRVAGIVSRGIFWGRPCEIEWLYGKTGVRNVFPEKWDEFVAGLKSDESAKHYLREYARLLNSADLAVQTEAARRWTEWEDYLARFRVDLAGVASSGLPKTARPMARIENHYFRNGCFFETPTWIPDNIDSELRKIPLVFAQGRYDMDCPRRTAWDLLKAWPEAEMITIPEAGHTASDEPVIRVLVNCTDWFALGFLGGVGQIS
jgi:proline iminopeptidase